MKVVKKMRDIIHNIKRNFEDHGAPFVGGEMRAPSKRLQRKNYRKKKKPFFRFEMLEFFSI